MASWLVLPLAAATACAQAADPGENRLPTSQPPRDGNVAIQEELEGARRDGTVAAYDLFLARHPQHPLAGAARREREALRRRR